MPSVTSPAEAPSCVAVMRRALEPRTQKVIVYSVDLRSTNSTFPFGLETFNRREDAERFIEEVRGDDPEIAATLKVEAHELVAGGLN